LKASEIIHVNIYGLKRHDSESDQIIKVSIRIRQSDLFFFRNWRKHTKQTRL